MRISDWSSDVCSSDLQFSVQRTLARSHRTPMVRSVAKPAVEKNVTSRRSSTRLRQLAARRKTYSRSSWALEASTSPATAMRTDRKSVVKGTRGSVRVELGGRRIIKKKKTKNKN